MNDILRVVDCASEDPASLLTERMIRHDPQVAEVVAEIIEDVRRRGDEALLENGRRFDAPTLAAVVVSDEELDRAGMPTAHEEALRDAAARVEWFHKAQIATARESLEWKSGGFQWWLPAVGQSPQEVQAYMRNEGSGTGHVGQRLVALSSAGVYVPGGKASYPSSVLMNAIPAQVAGVGRVVVTTPARSDGTLHPAVLYAAKTIGLTEIFKVGGAAAIAALAFGTESIPRVDKVVGPGNKYVNEAKRQLWGTVGLDGYAGPSEVGVLADDEANAAWAAADLLTQVEHSEDNAGYLITLSRAKLDEILAQVERQLRGAPREATMRAALKDYGLALVARDLDEALDLVNAIAPEHLTLAVRDPEAALTKVQNAGCVLLGEFTPESAGDFCLGPSHTLPTSGAARFGSPVSVLDFLKVQSVCRLTREDLAALRPTIEAFGEMEGFPAHGRGATIRFEDA